jgi:hypothetical protein
MGTDKTDPLKPKNQVFLLSVLVVKSVVKILQNSSSSMSAALPLWSKFLQNPVRPVPEDVVVSQKY